MNITLLQRGGLSVYGGSYDAKADEAVTDERQKQVAIRFPETITALALSGDPTTTTPVISDDTATFTISGTGLLECVATMGTDRPLVRIRAETGLSRDGYG